MKTISSIILTIVTFLLTIFPWSSSLEAKYQQLTYPGEMVITESVIEAVRNKDVEALVNMLSEDKRGKDLLDEINILIGIIDGEIIDAGWYSGGSDSVKKDYNSVESYVNWSIRFETTEKTYKLNVGWFRIDTNTPERVGMDSLALFDMNHNLLAEVY